MDSKNNEKQRSNLKSLKDRTPEEKEEIARKGGIASGEAKREKKLLSEIYGEVLAELYDIDAKKGASAKEIIKDIIGRRDSASVSMLKECREATEGQKLKIESKIPITVEVIGE